MPEAARGCRRPRQAFVAALPQPPQIVTYRPGAHTRAFWDSVTLPAFGFAAHALAA